MTQVENRKRCIREEEEGGEAAKQTEEVSEEKKRRKEEEIGAVTEADDARLAPAAKERQSQRQAGDARSTHAGELTTASHHVGGAIDVAPATAAVGNLFCVIPRSSGSERSDRSSIWAGNKPTTLRDPENRSLEGTKD